MTKTDKTEAAITNIELIRGALALRLLRKSHIAGLRVW
jgi:hypothetical protein